MTARRKAKEPSPQAELPLDDTPLPGSVMPRDQQEKMVRKPANDPIEGSRPGASRAHYSEGGDKDQTIPI